jgi:hypothetical protein
MTPDEMFDRLSPRLSPRRRLAAVVAALGGLATATISGLLLATEPDLPVRTRIAFALIVLCGLSWTGYGAWALTRTPLFALDRVVAGWLALVVTALVGAVTVARLGTEPAAIGVAAVLLAAAAANLVRARSYRSALLRRKRELGG